MTNAIKFTPEHGKIFVTLKVNETLNGKWAQIQITDTGQGLKPEFLTRIFQRFSQADSSTTRTHGGMGLGLAIVKSLVEMQNGNVTVESAGEGKGANFTVSLPLMPAKSKPISEVRANTDQLKKPVRLDGIKVLAVDDNEDNRLLFAIILKSLGANVQVADSAENALKILPEFKPDIVLSDISMPIEDGYSLLRNIRVRETVLDKKIPVVALTAHAGPEDVKLMLDAGFTAHIAKPVEKMILASVIAKLVRLSG